MDYHIGLGFGSGTGATDLKTKPKARIGKPGPIDKTSVVAEMTPHTRAPKWTLLESIHCKDSRSKLLDNLMIDNVHLNVNDEL